MPAANDTEVNFTVDNPGSYMYFQFEITATQGDGIMQLSEMKLWQGTDDVAAFYGPITVIPASPTNELTVELLNENAGPDTYTLTANVEGTYVDYVMSDVTFEYGKPYEISVKLPRIYAASNITVLGGQQLIVSDSESYKMLFDGDKTNKWCSGTWNGGLTKIA